MGYSTNSGVNARVRTCCLPSSHRAALHAALDDAVSTQDQVAKTGWQIVPGIMIGPRAELHARGGASVKFHPAPVQMKFLVNVAPYDAAYGRIRVQDGKQVLRIFQPHGIHPGTADVHRRVPMMHKN